MRGCVYVVDFSDGVLNVGRSNQPYRRIAELSKRAFAGRKAHLLRQWVSAEHHNCELTETRLIEWCERVGCRSLLRSRKSFYGVSFKQAVAQAQMLTAWEGLEPALYAGVDFASRLRRAMLLALLAEEERRHGNREVFPHQVPTAGELPRTRECCNTNRGTNN